MKRSVLAQKIEEDIHGGIYGRSGEIFPTVNQIALHYNVSITTASRAIHKLSDTGLLTLYGKHYYLTNGYAGLSTPYGSILKENAQPLLGLDLNMIDNPFFSSLAEKFTEQAKQQGYSLIIQSSSGNNDAKAANLKLFQKLHVSGVFAVPDINTDHDEGYRNCPLPLVILGRPVDLPNCDVVIVDNASAGAKVARHLVSMGCRSFIYLGLRNFIHLDHRLSGFRAKLEEMGMTLDEIQTVHDSADETLRSKIMPLVRKLPKPIGIFCYHDLLASEALRAIKTGGNGKYHIPQDVCIAGFDDLPITTITNPPLTTVAYRYDKIVEQAMAKMLDYIHNPLHQVSSVMIPCSLTVRQSTSRINL